MSTPDIPQATADKIRQIAEAANAEIARIEAESRGYDFAAINRECLESLIEQKGRRFESGGGGIG